MHDGPSINAGLPSASVRLRRASTGQADAENNGAGATHSGVLAQGPGTQRRKHGDLPAVIG